MKNVLKIFGIIVMAAVIGFPMVSCGGDSVVSIIGGVLTLTNLKNYSGKYVVAWGNNDTIVALSVNKQNGGKIGSDGSAVLSVWNVGSDGTPSTEYKGNDTVLFKVIISDSPNVNFTDGSDGGDGGWALTTFQKGIGAGVFTDVLSNIDIPDAKSGKLTLTGLESFNGKYIVISGSNEDKTLFLAAAASVDEDAQTAKGVKIKNGKAVMNVWIAETVNNVKFTFKPYKGNDTVTFDVGIYNKETVSFNEDPGEGNSGKALATFKNGIGAGIFYIGTEGPEQPPPGSNEISIDITVPSALVGTWTGDDTNGTLVFTATSISAAYTGSNKASVCIAAIKKANTSKTVTINANGTITKLIENFAYVNLYSWKIDGTTLTITDNVYNTTAFTGIKQ